MDTYVTACGLSKFIDRKIGTEIYDYQGGGYTPSTLDEIILMYMEEKKLEINTKFKKGTSNQKSRLKYRRVRKASKNFTDFSKWIISNKRMLREKYLH